MSTSGIFTDDTSKICKGLILVQGFPLDVDGDRFWLFVDYLDFCFSYVLDGEAKLFACCMD